MAISSAVSDISTSFLMISVRLVYASKMHASLPRMN
jgi:hypothetical protein